MRVEARSAAPLGPRHGIRAKQIRGVPDAPLVQLYPVKLSDGVNVATNPLGLVAGYLVSEDSILSMAPVRLPPMSTSCLLGCVEYTSMGDPNAMFSLHLTFLDAETRAYEMYSRPLAVEANGGVFRFDIPLKTLSREAAFTCALKVVVMDREKPVLIRSMWLEALG